MSSFTKSLEKNGAATAGIRLPLQSAAGFALLCLLPFILAWEVTRTVGALALANDSFSQILVIPLVSLYFIYERRKRVFARISFGWLVGAAFLIPGLIGVAAARFNTWHLQLTNQCVLFVFGVVLIWLGAFGLFFGTQAFRLARFPLLFMFFCVPIPEPILSGIVGFLQRESADAAEMFFRLSGVAYLRRDLVFELPGAAIRVAEECSGIRSSLALLITTVLASYLFLRTTWRKLVLCALVVPLAIVKNGMRIATLSTLAIYVDPRFLTGNLHHRGGIVFFMFALVPIVLVLIWLQRCERFDDAGPKTA